jgi:hypothetical protein
VDEARQDEVIAELTELARNYLRGAKDAYPEGYDIGDMGVAFDIHMPDGTSGVGYACSDGRDWVHAGLFRRAMLEAETGDGVSGEEIPDA